MTDETAVEVLEAGLLTSVQDAIGRWGSQRYGVSVSGALDAHAARAANAIVGNLADSALLEITWDGPVLRLPAPGTIAVTGAVFEIDVDGTRLPRDSPVTLTAGSTVSFGRLASGARAYLAVAGGIDVPVVLGSRSTDLRAGFGGFHGRALRAGDRLVIGGAADARLQRPLSVPLPAVDAPVRILPGPHLDAFDHDILDALCATTWSVSPQADRMGYRLDGPALARGGVAEVPSLGIPSGAIQVPGDGRPIVLLADHQPTGGYPVPAVAIGADLRLLAQRLPGDALRFQVASEAEAIAALAAQRGELRGA